MLPISQAARTKLMGRSLDDRIEVIITPNFHGAVPLTFEDKDIVPSSVAITKICASTTQIDIGTSMTQQLDVQLRYNFGENNFLGSKVETKYYLKLTSTTEEMLAHHTFYITEIEQTTPTIASIKAYCVANKFSKSIGNRVFSGTPFQILKDVNVCLNENILDVPDDGSVPQEFANFPNVTSTVQLTEAENGCNTCRDVINAVCQMIGVFVQAKPSTLKARLCSYHTTPDLTINLTNRKDFSHNRYTTTFTGLKVSGAKGVFTSPRGGHESDGTYIIDDAPCWDFGTETGLQARTDALKNLVTSWQYTAGEITMWSDPTIECGDRLRVITEDGEYELLVTEVTWNYMGYTVIRSAGEEQKVHNSAATSARRSSVTGNANKLVMYDVTNRDTISLDDEDDPYQLCRIAFSSIANTEVMWFGEALLQAIAANVDVPVTVTPVDSQGNPVTVLDSNGNAVVFSSTVSHKGDVKIRVTYKLDGTDQDYKPKDEYLSGDHILSMFFNAPIDEQSAHTWEVWIEVLKGAITINEFEFKGTLMGQNLVAQETWGGILTLFDDIGAVTATILEASLTDSLDKVTVFVTYDPSLPSTTPQFHRISNISDSVSHVPMSADFQNVSDNVILTLRYGDHICFCGEGYYCGTDGVLL